MIPLYKIRGLVWKKTHRNRWEAKTVMGLIEVIRDGNTTSISVWINGDIAYSYRNLKIRDVVKIADEHYRRLLVQNALITVCEVDDRGMGSIM